MNKRLMMAVIFLYFQASHAATAVPCAVVAKIETGAQIYLEKSFKHYKVDDAVECGSSISTHPGVVWIKTASNVMIKIAPDSYVELNQFTKEADFITLFRGKVLLQSPPQKKNLTVMTNQAKVDFNGGVAWVEYQANEKVSQVASFNKSVSLKNRFNEKAFQEVGVGEMSSLAFSDPRVVPRQPEVMSSVAANGILSKFKLEDAEQKEMVGAVERVYETRSKMLASELEGWREISKPQEEGRSLASETKKDSTPAVKRETEEDIQERESAFVMEQFKKRVFGGIDGVLGSKPVERIPASIAAKQEPLKDHEYDKNKKQHDAEKTKVLNEITDLEN